MRQLEKWLYPAHLRLTQQEGSIQDQRVLAAELESTNPSLMQAT